jgi:hypothetical protein
MEKEELKTFHYWQNLPYDAKKYTLNTLPDKEVRQCALIDKNHYAIAQSIIEDREKEQCEQRSDFLTLLRDFKYPILEHINLDKALYTLKHYNTDYVGNPFELKSIASSIAWNNTNSICSFIAKNKNQGASIYIATKNLGETHTIHEIPFKNTRWGIINQLFFNHNTQFTILQPDEFGNDYIQVTDIDTRLINYGTVAATHALYFDIDGNSEPLEYFFEYPLLIKKYCTYFNHDDNKVLPIDKITIPGFSSKYAPILKELMHNEGFISGQKKYNMSQDDLLTWARLFYTLGNISYCKEYLRTYKERTITELPITLRTIGTRQCCTDLSYKSSIENGNLDKICKACAIADSNEPLRSFLTECYKILYNKNNRYIVLEVNPCIDQPQKIIQVLQTEIPLYKINRCNKNHIYRPNGDHIIDVDYYTSTDTPAKIALLIRNAIAQKLVLYTSLISASNKQPEQNQYTHKHFIEEKSYELPTNYTAESISFDPYYDDEIINVYMQPELFDFLRIPIIRINTRDSTHTITHTLHKQLLNPITLVNYFMPF